MYDIKALTMHDSESPTLKSAWKDQIIDIMQEIRESIILDITDLLKKIMNKINENIQITITEALNPLLAIGIGTKLIITTPRAYHSRYHHLKHLNDSELKESNKENIEDMYMEVDSSQLKRKDRPEEKETDDSQTITPTRSSKLYTPTRRIKFNLKKTQRNYHKND